MINLDYLYNKDAAVSFFNRDCFVDKELGFSVIKRGTILPYRSKFRTHRGKDGWGFGGIVDSDNNFVRSSFVFGGAGEAYTLPTEEIRRSRRTVIYLGMFHSTWGHAITDNIRRLWFLKSDAFKSQFKRCTPVCLLCTKREIFSLKDYQNFRRLLEILGIDVDKIHTITQPTRFDKIILPDESFYLEGTRKFTEEYREAVECVRNFALKNRTPIAADKIYYFHGQNQIGEDRIAEYFKSKGYEIVSPEKLTFDEQLNILINCKSFASTLGSCSMNSVFLRDDTEAILIPRSANRFTGYQNTLNQVHPINAKYIDSSLSLFGRGQHFYCYVISERLKKFFGDKFDGYDEDDFKNFLQYVKNSISNNRVFSPETKKYYEPVLGDFLAQLHRREDLIAASAMPPDWEQNLL